MPGTNTQTRIGNHEATAEELATIAFSGFAHFTAMQVRDGRVKGLDLHLERLRLASHTLFGRVMPDEQVREHLASAIEGGPAAASLTTTMFSRVGEFTAIGAADDPAILVRTAPPSDGPKGPLRLNLVEHERPLFAIKHVGETAKTHLLREAVKCGYDDAAFMDRTGRIGEATIWNLAFWDDEAVVWPKADVLPGVTMGILRRQLDILGIPQRSAPVTLGSAGEFAGAVVMNSWTPGVAISAIGGTDLPVSTAFVSLLHQAYQAEPALDV